MDASPFRFRELPTEIRCAIYNQVFEETGIKSDNTIEIWPEPNKSWLGDAWSGWLQDPQKPLAISETCKELRDESLETLFTQATIELWLTTPMYFSCSQTIAKLTATLGLFHDWLRSVPHVKKARGLAVQLHPKDDEFNILEDGADLPWWTILHHSLQTASPALSRLSTPLVWRLSCLRMSDHVAFCGTHDDIDRLFIDIPEWSTSAQVFEIPLLSKAAAQVAVDGMVQQIQANVALILGRIDRSKCDFSRGSACEPLHGDFYQPGELRKTLFAGLD